MTKTIKVPGLSAEKIDDFAVRFLQRLNPQFLRVAQPIPLWDIFESGELTRVTGFRPDVDENLPTNIAGQTDFDRKLISLSGETHDDLMAGNSFGAFTVAHEIGHVVLHAHHMPEIHHEVKGRSKVLNRGEIPPYEDAEWQANTFGGALMIPSPHLMEAIHAGCSTRDLVQKFRVSWITAEIRMAFGCKKLKKSRQKTRTFLV